MRQKVLISGLIVLLLGALTVGVEDSSYTQRYLSFTKTEVIEALIAYAMARGFELPDAAQWKIECATHAPYPCMEGMWSFGMDEIESLRLSYETIVELDLSAESTFPVTITMGK